MNSETNPTQEEYEEAFANNITEFPNGMKVTIDGLMAAILNPRKKLNQ